MAGRNGYRSYRGKASKGKPVLAGVLVLVILAAAAVILVQKYIVYDRTGAPHMEVPWKETEQGTEEPVNVDLVIRPATATELLQGRLLPAAPLTQETCLQALAESGNMTAVTLKEPTGTFYWESAFASRGTVVLAEDTAAALQSLAESERWTVARLACFRDPSAAATHEEAMALKGTDGFIFYDGNNSQWLDPAKAAAREYLCAIAAEAAQLGFDEILLTDVSYPTLGSLDRIAYGEGDPDEHLLTFLREMRAALEPYGVKLALELSAEAVAYGGDGGLVLAEAAPLVDRIYVPVAPEEADACAEAVRTASETVGFVPMLSAAAAEGSYLTQ